MGFLISFFYELELESAVVILVMLISKFFTETNSSDLSFYLVTGCFLFENRPFSVHRLSNRLDY